MMDDALKATCCDAKEKNEGCYRAVTAERQLAACQKECKEQARLNGMGSEREARLMAQLAELQAKHDALVKDAERYRWLLHDHDAAETRERRRSICENLSVKSYSSVSRDIDAAMSAVALDEEGE